VAKHVIEKEPAGTDPCADLLMDTDDYHPILPYLTQRLEFRIPSNTMIPAGGFTVFDETEFNPNPGVPPSFAFSSKGSASANREV